MIVGTAGHIDHGKTSLVKALTGVDTDRLKEEKERGITIDLGFAYVPLPDGDVLGFVDVPGHERFVHTMLAGAASIDFVLLAVAADDGVMPQTREHLAIIDLLGIREGVVALTKADLADAARRAEVEAEVSELLAGSCLAGADILPVSSATGEGIEALKVRLVEEAASRPARGASGAFRLAIDRSFTLVGAGTVVTGVVVSGSIANGDRVVVLPQGIEARVRQLHAQGRPTERGITGQRCSVNLTGPGIAKDALARGDWLGDPSQPLVCERFDATLALAAGEPREIRQWSPIYLHLGTSAVPARVVLLEGDRLAPGARALVQIVLQRPLPVRHGDRFVVRDIGATRTMGGGMALDPRAPERHRRTPERLARLAALQEREPATALERLLTLPPGLVDLAAFAIDRALAPSEVEEIVGLLGLPIVEAAGARYGTTEESWARLRSAVEAALATFHTASPDLPGSPEERLRLAVKPRLSRSVFSAVAQQLARDGAIVAQGNWLRLPGHTSALAGADAKLWERVKREIEAEIRRPSTAREIAERVGMPVQKVRALCKTLARMGELIEVATDRFFLSATVAELGEIARELGARSATRTFTAAEFKDAAGTGRNVGIQVLEFFDRRGLTLRQGDVRRVVKDPGQVFGKR